ncbi:hypothetical protein M0R45_000365 [Rubus argutus]|uniref:BED-type domain-containing protein n=1 Tax=Rubus argutus TaxID=59490 RepID=A0AAW1VRF0_RUBAR
MMKKEDGVTDRNDKSICNFCRISISCDPKRNGTTALTTHLKGCKRSPCYENHDKRQRTLAFKGKEDGVEFVAVCYSQELEFNILGGLLENDADISLLGEKELFNEVHEDALPVIKDEELLQKSKSKDISLHKCKHISGKNWKPIL